MKNIVNFLRKQNSEFAWQMAEDAKQIEAWKIDEAGEPASSAIQITQPENFPSGCWVRCRFRFPDGETCHEDFYNPDCEGC